MDFKTLARSPLIAVQAVWVMARASRLPEAAGARSGTLGTGPAKSLLILGDSSAAGVGVANQSEALSGQLASELSKHYTISWKVVAQSGATVKSMVATVSSLPKEPVDLVIIALGVNDTKNGVRAQAWKNGYRQLLSLLSDKFGAPMVCVSGVPPLRHFPLLPYPLNDVLGTRAEQFDRILKEIAEDTENAFHLPMNFPLDPDNIAADGFHPSAKLYKEWAKRAATHLIKSQAQG